jgi:hypothetical protein
VAEEKGHTWQEYYNWEWDEYPEDEQSGKEDDDQELNSQSRSIKGYEEKDDGSSRDVEGDEIEESEEGYVV